MRCAGRTSTLADGNVRRTTSAALSDVRPRTTSYLLPGQGRIIGLKLLFLLARGNTFLLRLRCGGSRMKVLRSSGSDFSCLLPVRCSQQLIHTLLLAFSFFAFEAT